MKGSHLGVLLHSARHSRCKLAFGYAIYIGGSKHRCLFIQRNPEFT